MDTSTLKPLVFSELHPPLNPVLVQDAEILLRLQDFLKHTEGTAIGLDVETQVTVDFYDRRIRTIQVGNRDSQFVIDLLSFTNDLVNTQGNYTTNPCYKPIFDVLGPTLESKNHIKCGANLSFDYTALRWSFGIRMWHLYSVDIAERVLQAGAISLKKYAEFSLGIIMARRFGVSIEKELQSSFDLHTPLTESQIAYAALDTRLPLSIREHQIREATQNQLLTVIQIENDAIVPFAD